MNQTDPIADMLTRIRNAQQRLHRMVTFPYSRIKYQIIELLSREGYVGEYRIEPVVTRRGTTMQQILVVLKYRGIQPVIQKIIRASRPGRRLYSRATNLPRPLSGLGMAVVSTPEGIMSDRQARSRRLGGEVILYVW